MHDNHVGFQAAFPFGFVDAIAKRTGEILVFATFKFCVIVQRRSVFVDFATTSFWAEVVT